MNTYRLSALAVIVVLGAIVYQWEWKQSAICTVTGTRYNETQYYSCSGDKNSRSCSYMKKRVVDIWYDLSYEETTYGGHRQIASASWYDVIGWKTYRKGDTIPCYYYRSNITDTLRL